MLYARIAVKGGIPMANINAVSNNLTNLAQGAIRPAPQIRNAEQAGPDRNIRQESAAGTERLAPERNTPVTGEPQADKVQRETPAQRQERIEQILDNVISVSGDGDTLQASDEAVRELDEEEKTGRMLSGADNDRIKKEQEANGSDSRKEMLEFELERSAEIRRAQIEAAQAEAEARREAAVDRMREESEEQEEQAEEIPNAVLADEKQTIAEEGQINSFIGYSDAELERMYLKGDISSYDYNREMENRAETEEARKEDLADFSLDAGRRNEQLRQDRLESAEIERAFDENANERLDPAQRAQLLQVMQRTAQAAPPQQSGDPNEIAPLANFSLG